jgi:DNA-binding XRE family transcriptional regulator
VDIRIQRLGRLACSDIFSVLSEPRELLGLLQTQNFEINPVPQKMPVSELTNYLRSHRMRSGLSQRELAELVGFIADHQVSKHERSAAIPSLLIALSYSVVFLIPLEQLLPGIAETIQLNVENRLEEMEKKLNEGPAKGRKAQAIARKLEWLSERRISDAAGTLQ